MAGAVFVNELGKTERLNVEAFLFTFGKGEKDEARAAALEQIAEKFTKLQIEEAGVRGIRIWTVGTKLFAPVSPSISRGVGAYRVGIRVEGKTISKVDVRFRRTVGAVVDAVLGAVGDTVSWFRAEVFG